MDSTTTPVALDDLGFEDEQLSAIQMKLAQTEGLILVAGPPHSGKTTTMRAMIWHEAVTNGRTIGGFGDHMIEGGVSADVAGDWVKSMTAILRRGVDIISPDQPENPHQSKMLMEATLTGHVVISSYQANDAGECVTRLHRDAIDPYILAEALELIVAQRLVRALCALCRVVDEQCSTKMDEGPLWKAAGCEACSHTGYNGMALIAETLVVTDEVRDAIREGSHGLTLTKFAAHEGMLPMAVIARRKLERGDTMLEEVRLALDLK